MLTFEEWEATALSSETKMVGRNIIRDFYKFPNKIPCMEDYITPQNPFKKTFSRIVVSYIVPINVTIDGADVSGEYYTEEGFGVPVFEDMKTAYNFAMNLTSKE